LAGRFFYTKAEKEYQNPFLFEVSEALNIKRTGENQILNRIGGCHEYSLSTHRVFPDQALNSRNIYCFDWDNDREASNSSFITRELTDGMGFKYFRSIYACDSVFSHPNRSHNCVHWNIEVVG
jgi:hypothetical protein